MDFSSAPIDPSAIKRPPLRERIFNPDRILLFFTLLNFLVYFDRGALAGLLSVINEEYDLEEIGDGFLSGAFMLGYLIFYLLFNYLSSPSHIPSILFLGMLSWSLATLGTVWAPNFRVFSLLRMLTGAAEASFAGVAPVFIDDHRSDQSRFMSLSFYYVSIPIGAALGTSVAGYVDSVWDWRYLFGIEGLIMFPLSILCLVIPSQSLRDYGQNASSVYERGINVDSVDTPLTLDASSTFQTSTVDLIKILYRNKIYWFLLMGKVTYTFYIGAALFWTPFYIQEDFDMSLLQSNFVFGVTTLCAGIAGSLVGGYYLDNLPTNISSWSKCVFSVQLSCFLVGISVPISIGIYFSPNKAAVFVAIFMSQFLLYCTIGALHACIIRTLPMWIRPFALGFAICICHLFGDFPAAIAIGYAADWSGDLALCLSAATLLNIATILFWRAAIIASRRVRSLSSSRDPISPNIDIYMTHG